MGYFFLEGANLIGFLIKKTIKFAPSKAPYLPSRLLTGFDCCLKQEEISVLK